MLPEGCSADVPVFNNMAPLLSAPAVDKVTLPLAVALSPAPEVMLKLPPVDVAEFPAVKKTSL